MFSVDTTLINYVARSSHHLSGILQDLINITLSKIKKISQQPQSSFNIGNQSHLLMVYFFPISVSCYLRFRGRQSEAALWDCYDTHQKCSNTEGRI